MARNRDQKLDRLADLLGDGWTHDQLVRVGRLGDETAVDGGTELQTEGRPARWCYWLIDGTVAISQGQDPIAVCSAGTWLPGSLRPGLPTATATVTALDDARVLAFGRRDFTGAVESLPLFGRLLRSSAS